MIAGIVNTGIAGLATERLNLMSFSEDRKTKIWSVMRVSSGNFLEMYDFMVFGYYATAIGNALFPSGNPFLSLMLSLMSLGIISIAGTPGYSTIGFLAPLLVLIGRLLQGFSAGMELGGVSVYLSEIATPGHKGFYVSWQ